MPSTTFQESVTFTVLPCASCGIHFCVPSSFEKWRRDDGKPFYCPNGHVLSWNGSSEADRAQKLAGQLDIEKTRRENAEKAVRQAEITKKALSTKLRKTNARIKAGVCPCCNRTFQSLARHMTTKHPEFVAESAGEA